MPGLLKILGLLLGFTSGLLIHSSHASDPADEDYEYGMELYDLICSNCHGKNMNNPGSASFNLRNFPRDDRQRFIESVTRGKGFMPSFGTVLDTEEIEQLWIYVSQTPQ